MACGAPRLGRPAACPAACLARGVACGGAPCGRAPGAGVAGGPSVRPVGPGPAHRPWWRTHHPPRGAPPGGGLRVPGRVRPGVLPARLTTACSGRRWRGSGSWARFMWPSGAANAESLAGFRSGNGWRQASADPWGQDRDAGRADGAWCAASGVARGVPRGVRGACGRVRRRGAVALLARASRVARPSTPWGRGQRMARGGGRPIHPVAPSPAVACAPHAACGPAPAPV